MLEFTVDHYGSEESLKTLLQATTLSEVETSLTKSRLDAQDLLHLLSPAALPLLEQMARKAQFITRQRFGRVMKMYAPLYLSNECSNACVYCGFNHQHVLPRKTLGLPEVLQQATYLSRQGFQNVLLVSGESRKHVPVSLLAECIQQLRPLFPEVSVEVYPLETEEYRELEQVGLYGLTVYQETYLPAAYQTFHPSGQKRNYAYRLQTPERGALAGLRQVGLGILLGLSPVALDAFYLGVHARYLEKKYWRTLFGISFPRLRFAEGDFKAPYPVSDQEMVQVMLALRLFLPDAPFTLSTREPEQFRRQLLPLCFTQMSAGSRTVPGGYGEAEAGLEQFQVEDKRSAQEIANELIRLGFEPVWKDWDPAFERQA